MRWGVDEKERRMRWGGEEEYETGGTCVGVEKNMGIEERAMKYNVEEVGGEVSHANF